LDSKKDEKKSKKKTRKRREKEEKKREKKEKKVKKKVDFFGHQNTSRPTRFQVPEKVAVFLVSEHEKVLYYWY